MTIKLCYCRHPKLFLAELNMHSSPHTLMVQGTTSDAGKSTLVAAICRILARNGISVAPFKPQNMALNSAVTADGGEIGRAQAVQAEAAYLEPSVEMNPVLLKPNSDTGAQVIVMGKAIGNWEANHFFGQKSKRGSLLPQVLNAHNTLQQKHGNVIVEGAGSPAEINLREHDIANMGFAEAADCPVIVVGDIDRGGVFAHLVGTYELLSKSEQQRIKGFVINRFRGDISLLQSGLEWLQERTGVPVLGVIPYIHDLHIEAEDAINIQQQTTHDAHPLKVVVPVYPRISNHTDFDVLRLHPQVDLQFVRNPEDVNGCDLIILPGSKNVREDLNWLISNGWKERIQKHLRYGGKVLGICGGYQMLGNWIHDQLGVESQAGSSEGLGFLEMETKLNTEKTLRNITGISLANTCPLPVKGYEIHAGESYGPALETAWFEIHHEYASHSESFNDGCISEDNQIRGTYIHGVLDQQEQLEEIMHWAGLTDGVSESFNYYEFKQAQINRLADEVEKAIPLSTWKQLLSL